MAGLSAVCNYVGAVLYKQCMWELLHQTCLVLHCQTHGYQQLLRRLFCQLRLKTSTSDSTKWINVSQEFLNQNEWSFQPNYQIQLYLSHLNSVRKISLSNSKYKQAILSIHEKFNKPYYLYPSKGKCWKPSLHCIWRIKWAQHLKNLLNVQSQQCNHIKQQMMKYATWIKPHNSRQSARCGVFTEQAESLLAISSVLFGLILTNHLSHCQSLAKKICYPQQHAFANSATRWGCEHQSTAVDEFFNWFPLNMTIQILLSCGFVINKKFLF